MPNNNQCDFEYLTWQCSIDEFVRIESKNSMINYLSGFFDSNS